jgi:uncharacterized glyoxalase superfamily protein PhnB
VTDRPVFTGVVLLAHDVEASMTFYERLGATFSFHPNWRRHHVTCEAPGGLRFEIDSHELSRAYDTGWVEPVAGTSRAILVFEVPSRDAVDDRFAAATGAGAHAHLPPFDAFWGARYAVVDDPDGNQVGLMSPVDESRQTAPPAL